MATRQYIGARYVPKFYDYNGSTNWRSGTEYEALTIVTLNGNSYTSKIPVPSNVGSPDQNPDYWVATGMYNEQVEAYRQLTLAVSERLDDEITNRGNADTALGGRIDAEATARENADTALGGRIDAEATARENADTALGNRITANLNVQGRRKFIFLGDSYNADYHDSWGQAIITKLGLTLNTNAWLGVTPGGGFGAVGENGNFYTLLQSVGSSMTEEQRLSITDVVIGGSVNDYSQTEEDIANGIINCDNYVTTYFPNAKYYIACCGWSYRDTTIRSSILQAYNKYNVYNKHAAILQHAFMALALPQYMKTDMVHPTANGNLQIAYMIIDFINGGGNYYRENPALNAVFGGLRISGRLTDAGLHIWRTAYGGIELSNAISFSNTVAGVLGTADASNNYLFSQHAEFPMQVMVRINDGGTNVYKTLMCVGVVDKTANAQEWTFKIYNRAIVDGSFTVSNVEAVYPVFNCMLPLDDT